MKPIRMSFGLLLLAAAPALADPPAWTVDKGKSEVGFSGQHVGMDFKGQFGQWDATILFDPADLAHSSAKVIFQMATAKTADATETDRLTDEEWLNPAKFPTGTFTSTSITASGGANYVAKGTLVLKGKSLPASLPFTLTISGSSATLKGTTTVDRTAYDIGMESDPSGTYVSKDIAISVDLVATRK